MKKIQNLKGIIRISSPQVVDIRLQAIQIITKNTNILDIQITINIEMMIKNRGKMRIKKI